MQLNMKRSGAGLIFLMASILTACTAPKAPEPTLDSNAIYTSVAGTMIAQLGDHQTQTAQAIPPSPQTRPTAFDTFTPLPVFPVTPLSTPLTINTPGGALSPTPTFAGGTPGGTGAGCADSNYISETEPRDGTQFSKGENFSKSWTFLNTGTCVWINNFAFGFQSGDRLGGKNVVISRSVDFVSPGQTKTFTINFEAPNTAGRYKAYWQMRSSGGGSFGSRVWVDIVVK